MKLLFIRHGDPDYTIDSLTEKGWKEAEFLSEKIAETYYDEIPKDQRHGKVQVSG